MVKECKIIHYNKYQNVVIVDFEGIQLQLPAKLNDGAATCYIEKKDNKYFLSNEGKYKAQNSGDKPVKDTKIIDPTKGVKKYVAD